MADERSTGLILRTRPLTETSLIVHWLTGELGRIATVAKGARRPNSPYRGKLDLFFLADLSFVRSRRSELHTLREVIVRNTHSKLRTEIGYLQQASYFVALVEQTTEIETPLPEIFPLMSDALSFLPLHPIQPLTVFSFELKLLHVLGLAPELDNSSLSPGARQIVLKCLDEDWKSLTPLRLSSAQAKELAQFLHGFLIFHLEKIPAARHSALALPEG